MENISERYLNAEPDQFLISSFATVLERSFNPHDSKHLRVPFYITSSYRQNKKIRGVSMMVNPSSVSFSQSKRITQQYTQGGAVFYHWTNRDGRNNGILEMEFSGQTGNINLKAGLVRKGASKVFTAIGDIVREKKGKENRRPFSKLNDLSRKMYHNDSLESQVKIASNDYIGSGSAKLANFLNLYSLTREPLIDPETGDPITYYISYSTPTFGNTFVIFEGHFSRVLDFTDDAMNPNSVNYSFGFTVRASYPPLDEIYRVATTNLSMFVNNPIDTYEEGKLE
jgi:hypothetical protein